MSENRLLVKAPWVLTLCVGLYWQAGFSSVRDEPTLDIGVIPSEVVFFWEHILFFQDKGIR